MNPLSQSALSVSGELKELDERRIVRRLGLSFVSLMTFVALIACGPGNDPHPAAKNGGAGGFPNEQTSARCADAKLSQNLTPEEFAIAASEYEAILQGKDPDDPANFQQLQTAQQISLQTAGPMIAATPPGGQARYAKAVCDGSIRDFPMNRHELQTSVLLPGYSGCLGAKASVEAQASNPEGGVLGVPIEELGIAGIVAQADLNRNLKQIAGLGQGEERAAKALEFLCPQVPVIEPAAGNSPQYCEKKVALAEGGTEGLVLVAKGDVQCDQAVKLIPESAKYLNERELRFGNYSANGDEYICRGLAAAESEDEGYGYECRTDDDSTVVIWKLEATN